MDLDMDGDVDLADFAVIQTLPMASGASHDCNSNGTPDECEIHQGSTAPGGPFFCEVYCDPDSNSNGVPDECDECLSNAECDDEDPCTENTCVGGNCVFTPFAAPHIENLDVFYADRFADEADPSRSFLASGSPATNA
ncbi:unnamed protein product, partial [marine sediment metagenome]